MKEDEQNFATANPIGPAQIAPAAIGSGSPIESGGVADAALAANAEAPAVAPPQKSHLRRVVGGTFYYGLGQSLQRIIRFALIPVFAHFLTLSDQGVLELATKFGAFLIPFMQWGVPSAFVRFYYDFREGESLRDYTTTVARFLVISTLVASVAAIVVFALVGNALIPGLPLYPFAILAVLSSVALTGQELQNRLVQAREQAPYMARLTVGRAGAAIVMALLFVVVFRWGATGMLLSEVISYSMLAGVAVWYLWPDLHGRFRWGMLRSSFKYGVALLPGDFAVATTALAAPAILAYSQGVDATGALSIANRFMQAPMILGYAFATAYNPIYFSARTDGTERSARRLTVTMRNVWAAAVVGAPGGVLLGPPAIRLMTPVRYHVAIPLLPILCLGLLGFAAHTVTAAEIYYRKKTWWVSVIAYSSTAANVVVTLLTVNRLGALGAACGLTAQSLVAATLEAIISARLHGPRYPWFSLARITTCGAATYLFALHLAPQGLLAWRYGFKWTRLASLQPLDLIPHGWLGWIYGAGSLSLFAALLWIGGDPSVREGFALARRQIKQRLLRSES